LGVTGLDLSLTVRKWHAEDAWWASLITRAQINANNDALIAEAEAIANGAAQPVLVG
jgi:hypothetical protein